MKTCFKCGAVKETTEFYKHPQMGDGLLGKCKECTKTDSHKTRRDNIEYYREYDIARSKLPHRKELAKSRLVTFRVGHPDENHAHALVQKAVKSGKLHKPSNCSRCGKAGMIHGHHNDYSKPLEVEWLCVVCHSMEKSKPQHKEIPYRQPVFSQMELFEPRSVYIPF